MPFEKGDKARGLIGKNNSIRPRYWSVVDKRFSEVGSSWAESMSWHHNALAWLPWKNKWPAILGKLGCHNLMEKALSHCLLVPLPPITPLGKTRIQVYMAAYNPTRHHAMVIVYQSDSARIDSTQVVGSGWIGVWRWNIQNLQAQMIFCVSFLLTWLIL